MQSACSALGPVEGSLPALGEQVAGLAVGTVVPVEFAAAQGVNGAG